MTSPAFGVRLTIDATGSAQGRDVHVRSIEDVKKANAGLTPSMQATTATIDQLRQALVQLGTPSAAVEKLMQQYAVSQRTAAATSAGLSGAVQHQVNQLRGLGIETQQVAEQEQRLVALRARLLQSSQQATQAQQQYRAALAGTQVAIAAKRQADEQLVASQYAIAQATTRANATTVTAAAATEAANPSFRRLSSAVSQLSFAAAGVPGPVGRVASILGGFALGGGVTAVVVVGLAAIVAGINSVRDASERAAKPIKDLQARLEEFRKSQITPREAAQLDVGIANAVVQARQRDLDQLLQKQRDLEAITTRQRVAGLPAGQAFDAAGAVANLRSTIATTTKLRDDARRDEERANQQLTLRVKEETDKKIEDAKRLAAEQKRLADEAQRHREQAAKEALALEITMNERRIEAERAAQHFLTAETEQGLDEREKALATRRAKESQALSDSLDAEIARVTGQLPADVRRATQAKEITDHASQQAREMAGLFNDAFKDFFARGLKDWEAFFFAVQQLAGNAASLIAKDIAFKMKEGLPVSGAQRAAGNALAGASAGLGVGLGSRDPGIGLVGGAAAGFVASGFNPLGAIAGGVAGFVSGLLASAADARKAAEQMRQAEEAFARSMTDFVAIANPRGALDDSLEALKRQMEDLQTAALAIRGIVKSSDAANAVAYRKRLEEIEAQYQRNVIALKAQLALEQQRFAEDLSVRALRAQGFSAEADAEAFRLAQVREFQEAVEKYGKSQDAAILTQLGYVQGLEREAFFKAQAAEAQRKLNEQISLGLSLDEQIFTAKGDAAGAARARRDQGIFDTTQGLQSGALSPENAQKTFDLIWLTFTNTMRDIADAAEATTLALFNYNRAQREDLGVRLLIAQGQDAEAATRRLAIDQQREYSQAVKDGADAVTLAYLQQVQAAEAVAFAAARAADEAKRLADALAAEARATEDLTVRSLRASGQGGAADTATQFFQQQEERRRAVEAGRSQTFLDELDRVQTQERAAADAARRAAQEAAFNQNFGLTSPSFEAASPTTVNLAVGVSESTANRMTGILSAQLIYQASLPRIEALLRLIATQRALAGGGVDLQDIDEELGALNQSGDFMAGNPPSNR